MIGIKPIIPKRAPFTARIAAQVADSAMRAAAESSRKDFEATVKDWKQKPVFVVKKTAEGIYSVTTDDPIWLYGDEGTKPHDIVAHKIALRFMGAGGMMFRKRVHHPGTKAHHWSQQIAKKWQNRLATFVQQRINEAMK